MRKKKQVVAKPPSSKSGRRDVPATYDLYRTLPNPLYEQYGQGRAVPVALPQEEGQPRWKRILISLAILLGVVLVGAGGWVGWKLFENFGWQNLLGLFDHTRLKGEDVGRVNVLLAGYSADDAGHSGAQLTDSIMLVSIDTKLHKAFMLSIPRDLYVNIPNNGYAKINEAYQDGEREHFSNVGYPAGGMGLLEEVVSQKFNVPINYYALIDYTAFRDAVNAVGGISISVQSDDPRGLYDPSIDWTTHGPLVKLSSGMHTLNGEQALDLARARGDAYGSYGFPRADFDRTMHQREMLTALAGKATSVGVLSNPVKIGQLFDAFGNNVKTDLQLKEIRRLYALTKQIPNSNIASASLNDANYDGQKHVDLLTSYRTPYGQSALIPVSGVDDYTQIDGYVAQLESNN
jgi:polyisoprenyl-teichoic acid--peptidoglycan teichoic acid transferase